MTPAKQQEIDQAVALNICNYERTSLLTVDVVAVDVNPSVWAAFCEECDSYFGSSSTDPAIAQGDADRHFAEVHNQ